MPDGAALIDLYGNELRTRRLAKTSLAAYASYVEIPNVPLTEISDPSSDDPLAVMPAQRVLAKHHKIMCDAIHNAVTGVWRVDGQPVNVMLFFPPGSGKSSYADVVAAPWIMASQPQGLGDILLASHGTDIAEKQGRKARQLVRSRFHTNVFPNATLNSARGAAGNWQLSNGHQFYAAGLLSGITGSRCYVGVLDDPMRGREAAESETQREKAWDAYLNDFCSRLLPGGVQIMMLTRWHQADIPGRILPDGWAGESGLLKGRDGRWWYVICAPAIADRADDPIGRSIGEGLWPEWFKTGHWEPFKVNARTWNSLYQQKPTAPQGTYFKRAWFNGGEADGRILPTRRYETLPRYLNIFMSSDHADTQDGGDYTVLRVWGIDVNRELYWIDGFRGQVRVAEWVKEAITLINKYKPLCWFPENDTIFRTSEAFVRTQMRDKRAVCRIEKLSTAGEKTSKAQPFQGMAEMGMVHLPAEHLPTGAAANDALEEYVAFPGGKNDDEVDAGANIGRALMDAHPAIVLSKAPAETRLDAWGNREPAPEHDWRVA